MITLKSLILSRDVENLKTYLETLGYDIRFNKNNEYIEFFKSLPDKGEIPIGLAGDERQIGRQLVFSFKENTLTIRRYMRRGKYWSSRAGSMYENWNIFAYSSKDIIINFNHLNKN